MYNIDDIYVKYRQAQARYHNRPYVIPKNLNDFFKKMNKKSYYKLELLTKKFNTAFRYINPDIYFDCGFSLYKRGFTYHRFLDEKVINLYIIKDKNIKRDITISKRGIINSIKFITKWIGEKRNKKISLLLQYSSMYDNNRLAPIIHYNMNKIDKYFFVWLIRDGYIKLSDEMKNEIPIIINNYRNLIFDLTSIDSFLSTVEKKIKEM